MINLPQSLLELAQKYNSNDITQDEKKSILEELYYNYKLSWKLIGNVTNTYANKVRRDAVKFGIQSRDKSKAQKLALDEGRHTHPTKNIGHSEESKIKISNSIANKWSNIDDEERECRRQAAKERWSEKSEDEIRNFRLAAGEGVRRAAKEGSELEKYLFYGLIRHGYKPEFHKEHWVIRDKLQIDIFIPDLNVAIEVDGPSHFSNIWGEDNLRKNQERDAHKSGLLLERGNCIIRVQQVKQLSNKYKRDLLNSLLNTLYNISKTFPPIGERNIIIKE